MIFFELPDGEIICLDYQCGIKTKTLMLAHLSNYPNLKGCYIYFDAAKQPLYVGKSTQLLTRLAVQATKRGIEKQLNWASIGIILSNNPHILEIELIMKLQPLHNKLNK